MAVVGAPAIDRPQQPPHAPALTADDDRWRAVFPALFASGRVDYADIDITFTTQPVPTDQVSRLHVVAVTALGRVVVCRSVQGWRFLPGGTRELDETLQDLARRELLEEAGARLGGPVRPFGAHAALSRAVLPYRSHLPHPRAYWLYGVSTAELVQPPTNPSQGEHVVEVLALPPEEAAAWLHVTDPIHADVVRLALAMGLVAS